MTKKKSPSPKRKGRPKLKEGLRRSKLTLTFDPSVATAAKAQARKEGKSLSLWLEDLAKAALEK